MRRTKANKDEISQQLSDVHSNNICIDSREIYIIGDYHSGDEINHMTAIDFIKNIHFLDRLSNDAIVVHMIIEGGDWHYGLAMMDAIYAAKSKVIIQAYSQASSMSGVILQAAYKRIMMPHTYFLMHYGVHSHEGVSQAAHAAAKENEKSCKKMLDIFANRAAKGKFAKEKGYDVKKLAKFFDKKMKDSIDWYLTAEEAVYYGLADSIYKKPRGTRQ